MSNSEVPPSVSEGKRSIVNTTEFSAVYLAGQSRKLSHFLTVKAPIPKVELLRGPALIAVITSKEPGPKFRTELVSSLLQAARGWFLTVPFRKKMLDDFEEYLSLRQEWIAASAEAMAFDVHNQMTRAVYFSKDDEPLIKLIKTKLPDVNLDAISKAFPPLTLEQYLEIMIPMSRHLHAKADALTQKLLDLKTTERLRITHSAILKCTHAHDDYVKALRNREYNDRLRKHHAREQTVLNARRQMGNVGAHDLSPPVVRSVMEFVRQEQEKYLAFDEAGQLKVK
ncbi:hypothetical protein PV10_00986 [Exophiala mesophila]|uniref:Uncharacterized protein n=1 Tax=Exophiala mesophila TaxID=212818 RepID=A0A0D1X5Y9_EXOME|nr:uncharacterized protein PV10_00986 [Exophiala mesophila]KIV97210.1 hypothetical protein PV10_00986 [Exophiala mesophila]